MAAGSDVSLRIDSAKVPLLEGAMDCIRAGFIPGGLKNNREFAECLVGYEANVPEEIRTILFDPQTAGGLLLSVARSDADPLVTALNNAGVPAVEIGEVLPQGKPLIQVS
jgi:selenide,water dikinase